MGRSVIVKAGTTIPAEPLTLNEAKLHLRVETSVTEEDTLINALITGAREWCENYCRRSFVRRTLELRLDCFPEVIKLPFGPVASVTHVKYTDGNGTVQTWSSGGYQTDLYGTPPRILPVFGGTWPTIRTGTVNAVLVEYEAGYAPGSGSPTDYTENIPEAVRAAMKLIIGHLYENREQTVAGTTITELPFAVKALLAAYEIRDFTLE